MGNAHASFAPTGHDLAANRKAPGKRSRKRGKQGKHEDALSGLRVLVVEDDAASRKLAAILLADAGAEVTTVHDAEQALAAIQREAPEFVVLDLLLPSMSGLELVRQVKADKALQHIGFIAVTSLNGPEIEEACLAAGCDAYMRKPIDGEMFVRKIASLIGGWEK